MKATKCLILAILLLGYSVLYGQDDTEYLESLSYKELVELEFQMMNTDMLAIIETYGWTDEHTAEQEAEMDDAAKWSFYLWLVQNEDAWTEVSEEGKIEAIQFMEELEKKFPVLSEWKVLQ